MINCPNCDAPIEPYRCKCEYCGTWYYDLTGFDLTDGKLCYVKFKTINIDGQEISITALAKPHLENIEFRQDTIDICSPGGVRIHSFVDSRHCDIGVIFECYEDKETKTLFQIESKGDK